MLRSLSVTMFILICIGAAIAAMGQVYTVVEQNAFGRKVSAFSVTEMDYLSIFGKEVYFPVMSVTEKVGGFVKRHCPGTVKLLGFAVNGTEELVNELFG